MTQEEKKLLTVALGGYFRFGVKMNCFDVPRKLLGLTIEDDFTTLDCGGEHIYHPFNNEMHTGVLPYLRPMSSMTDAERKEFYKLNFTDFHYERVDWLDEHKFDYRGLIPMGLAYEATEDMYD